MSEEISAGAAEEAKSLIGFCAVVWVPIAIVGGLMVAAGSDNPSLLPYGLGWLLVLGAGALLQFAVVAYAVCTGVRAARA